MAIEKTFPQTEVSQQARQARRRFEGYVAEKPASSILVGFGVGFGLGLVLGMSISERPSIPWKEPSRAERLGQQILEAMENVLPESLSKRMHVS